MSNISNSEHSIPRRSFRQEMKRAVPEHALPLKWSEGAVQLLQSACENEVIDIFARTKLLANHAKRTGITDTDIKLAMTLSSKYDSGNTEPTVNTDNVTTPKI